jgi:hypothetical protein
MRKTIKAKPYLKESTDSSPDSYAPNESDLYNIPTPEDVQTENDKKNRRVTELINQMSTVNENNDGSKLADFNPPPYANTNSHTDNQFVGWTPTTSDEIDQSNEENQERQQGERQRQRPIPKIQAHNELVYGSNYNNTKYGNYHVSYDPSQLVYPASSSSNSSKKNIYVDDSRMMEKINYMIRLLEEQAVEKTANITEEFILYTFLGVFIIFVLDSFVRVGKYVR